ncbi:MAG: 3'-5' exonuclease domain-containing protein 2 [Muribaculaceae bacterium]|nr:3'-5' exonuclease domain-containing protein 2 [Muribaculaceae bacterium]
MISIDKKDIIEMPIAAFNGRSIVIDNAADARQATAYLSKLDVIGFDTETRPVFRKGDSHKVALVQMSTDDECFLFRTNKMGLTEHLIKLLENPDVVKVGLSTKDDFHGLNQLAPCNPRGFVELQQYVKRFDIADMSLQRIYAIIFGEHISKGQRLTNWEAPTLSSNQIGYASLDAWACLRIYRTLSEGRFDPATSPYIVNTADK